MEHMHAWLDHIVGQLFAADDRRIKERIQALNDANSRIRKTQLFGFMHRGKRFIDPRFEGQTSVLAKTPVPTLALQLNDELKSFDLDRDRVEIDRAKIRQALLPLLVNCNSLQDLRDTLPECIIHMVPQLVPLKRQRTDNASFIRSDKYAMKAYEKALPLIEAYSVSNLIY